MEIEWKDDGDWYLEPAAEWGLGKFVYDYARGLAAEILGEDAQRLSLAPAAMLRFDEAKRLVYSLLTRDSGAFIAKTIGRLGAKPPVDPKVERVRVTQINEGAFSGIFRVDVREPFAATFGLVVAREADCLGPIVRGDFRNLEAAHSFPALGGRMRFGDFVVRPGVATAGVVERAGHRKTLPAFSAEWLEGYDELHRDPMVNGGNFFLHMMPPRHFYDRIQSRQLMAKLIELLVLLFETTASLDGAGLAIAPLLLQAGDLVVRHSEDGDFLKLITLRRLVRLSAPEFLASLVQHRELTMAGDASVRLYFDDQQEVFEATERALLNLHGGVGGQKRWHEYKGCPRHGTP